MSILTGEFSYQEIDSLCNQLAMQLEDTHFDFILGINRGGVIPATMISHTIDNDNLRTFSPTDLATDIIRRKGRYLIIDEIFDSGKTVVAIDKKISSYVNSFFLPGEIEIEYAVLLRNTDAEGHDMIKYSAIDFSRTDIQTWFKFPWEKE